MTSNFKGKSTSREAPTEPFKRSVAACLKAIARKPELEVGYAAERPGFAGGNARWAPGRRRPRGVCEGDERARVEASGARRMEGVARNLSAMLEDRFHRGK